MWLSCRIILKQHPFVLPFYINCSRPLAEIGKLCSDLFHANEMTGSNPENQTKNLISFIKGIIYLVRTQKFPKYMYVCVRVRYLTSSDISMWQKYLVWYFEKCQYFRRKHFLYATLCQRLIETVSWLWKNGYK